MNLVHLNPDHEMWHHPPSLTHYLCGVGQTAGSFDPEIPRMVDDPRAVIILVMLLGKCVD